ncbi:LysR family transcriptional regulator [Mesobacillus zeae]|uniref:LysR family transcriptional regulator n=1 Tax=Mesobacillus zeae TaxID=1917180 RepID=A0A398B336_9BACI|nr:LysR family transcriptional regulator [Mesobacillus zeae]RID82243.1 LysR family transcriptional regulator [Mesobacillus zeae]
MEFRQLRFFAEAAKQKSITKASEVLHISQPALSKAIKGLEEELGTTLLIRTNKTSELTDAGEVVLDYALRMGVLLEEMTTTLNDLSELKRGEVHIGLPPFIGSLLFPKVMAKFHHHYPNIKLNIAEYGGARVVKSVEEGEMELGVAVLPLDDKQFRIYPILEEEMQLVVHEDHPLGKKQSIDMSDLADEEFIFYNEEFALYKILREYFISAGFEPKILFQSSQWDLMSEMAAANLGITILPASICRRVPNKELRFLGLRPPVMWRLAVITKKDRYLSRAARTLIDFILSSKGALGQEEQ